MALEDARERVAALVERLASGLGSQTHLATVIAEQLEEGLAESADGPKGRGKIESARAAASALSELGAVRQRQIAMLNDALRALQALGGMTGSVETKTPPIEIVVSQPSECARCGTGHGQSIRLAERTSSGDGWPR